MAASVEVIGYTMFLGVPDELTKHGIAPGQDEGSDRARLIECAGRNCYDSYGKGRSSEGYHQHILEVGHGSVLEHASISFYISGISRGTSHEWVRHRAGTAISQRSTRYVDESSSDWQYHPLIENFIRDQGLGDWEEIVALEQKARALYAKTVSNLESLLVIGGLDKLSARKQARGAARGLLGNALSTSMVWSANIRALRNVIEQRASAFADAEIRLLANRVYEKAKFVCPEYFSDYIIEAAPDGIGYCVVTSAGHKKV